VADALTRKNHIKMEDSSNGNRREIIEMKKINAQVSLGLQGSLLAQLKILSAFQDRILKAQWRDMELDKARRKVEIGVESPYRIVDDGMVMMGKRIFVIGNVTLKNEILREAHESKFVIHPRSTKMYKDLKELYWCPNMKRDIAEYVTKYAVCQ
jgi:hypothetical protein